MSNDDDFDPYFVSPDMAGLVDRAQHSAIAEVDRQFKADAERRTKLSLLRGEVGLSGSQLLHQMAEDQKRITDKVERILQAVEQKAPTAKVAEQEKTNGSPKRFPKPILDG